MTIFDQMLARYEIKRVEKEYFIDCKKLNSLDYGVPQFRERGFFIGIKKEYIDDDYINQNILGHRFPFPINQIYQDAASKYNWGKPEKYGQKLTQPQG